MREIMEQPYSPDEERVVDFIQRITNSSIGGGDDPIGFLLSSYEFLSEKQKLFIRYENALKLIYKNISTWEDIHPDKKSYLSGLIAGALDIESHDEFLAFHKEMTSNNPIK